MTAQELCDKLAELGWSRQALADHLGVTRRQAIRWCVGDTPVPRYVALVLRQE
jgi:hypothetical protein